MLKKMKVSSLKQFGSLNTNNNDLVLCGFNFSFMWPVTYIIITICTNTSWKYTLS